MNVISFYYFCSVIAIYFSLQLYTDLFVSLLQFFSCKGLQHLKVLESLNLYYNNVTTLAEVHKLRNNYSLQELDLRLNPVARNEPDYRLFVIHMLPNLRRLGKYTVATFFLFFHKNIWSYWSFKNRKADLAVVINIYWPSLIKHSFSKVYDILDYNEKRVWS